MSTAGDLTEIRTYHQFYGNIRAVHSAFSPWCTGIFTSASRKAYLNLHSDLIPVFAPLFFPVFAPLAPAFPHFHT